MDIKLEFEKEICFVLGALKSRIEAYPSPLREQGLRYLEKRHLLIECKERTCEAYILIPFWLQATFCLKPSVCRKISLATIFSVLYFMTQDEVMDASNEYKGDILPLSSMFYYEFTREYHSLFNPQSRFWNYFETYMLEWSQSVLWERANHWGKVHPYADSDLILLARKTSGIKLPFAAACILADKEHFVRNFSDMVDYDQVVYQLYDDWRDWCKDLKKGNYTYLLVEAARHSGIGNASSLSENVIERTLLDKSFCAKYFGISCRYNKMAGQAISTIDSSYMQEYINVEAEICIYEPIRSLYTLIYGIKGDIERLICE